MQLWSSGHREDTWYLHMSIWEEEVVELNAGRKWKMILSSLCGGRKLILWCLFLSTRYKQFICSHCQQREFILLIYSYSNKIFILQKEVLKTITGNWDSRHEVLKELNIVTLTSQYIVQRVWKWLNEHIWCWLQWLAQNIKNGCKSSMRGSNIWENANSTIQAGVILHYILLHDFPFLRPENLHHFSSWSKDFWFNAIWHRWSVDLFIYCRWLARSDVNVTLYILCFMFCYLELRWICVFSEVHRIFTREVNNFYQPMPKSTLYQRGIINMGIQIYNKLSPFI